MACPWACAFIQVTCSLEVRLTCVTRDWLVLRMQIQGYITHPSSRLFGLLLRLHSNHSQENSPCLAVSTGEIVCPALSSLSMAPAPHCTELILNINTDLHSTQEFLSRARRSNQSAPTNMQSSNSRCSSRASPRAPLAEARLFRARSGFARLNAQHLNKLHMQTVQDQT